jgi:hypothetical protein
VADKSEVKRQKSEVVPWSSGQVVEWSSDGASGFLAGSLGHWITGSLCLFLLLAACEVVPSEQFTPQLVVHGQLQVGNTDSLYVQVNRTYRTGETYDRDFGEPVILISRGSDTTRPTAWEADAHFHFRPSLSVRRGDTFNITVAESAFDTVRGRTVVPDTFRFLYPRNGDTVTLLDSLGWSRSRTAAGYYFPLLRVESGESTSFTVVIGNDSMDESYDSMRVHFPRMFFYYGDAPGWKSLVVYAVDSNYYDWMRLVGYGSGGGAPPETTHLTGGLGVFGSAAVETLSFYLKTDTTFRRQPHCPTGAVEAKSEVGNRQKGTEGWRGQRNE